MTEFKNFDPTKMIHAVVYEPSPSNKYNVNIVDIVSFSDEDEAKHFAKSLNKGCNEGYSEYCFAKIFTIPLNTENKE